jgi:hypothetical protein
VSGNSAGGLLLSQATASVTNCTINSNSADGVGARGSDVAFAGGGANGNTGAGVAALDGTVLLFNGALLAGNGNSGLVVRNGSAAAVARAEVVGNAAPARAPPDGGGVLVEGNSSLVMLDSLVEGNTALRDGGGLHFDGVAGGALSLMRVTLRNNSARAFGGGLRAFNSLQLVATAVQGAPAPAPDFFMLPATNGTHLFAFTANCVLNAIAIISGPAYGRFIPISGTPNDCGNRDGRQAAASVAARPTYAGLNMRGALSNDGRQLYTTAVLRNYQLQYSPLRVVDLCTGDAATLSPWDPEINATLASQARAVSALAVDATGKRLFVGHRAAVRAVALTGAGDITTVAGRAASAPEMRDGACAVARFAGPEALALGQGGVQLYVIDALPVNQYFALREITLGGSAGCVVRTLVSDRGKVVGVALSDGPPEAATLGDIWGLAFSPGGLLVYTVSYTYACVRAVSLATGHVITYSGKCSLSSAGDAGGGALEARYNVPENIVEASGELYLHDKGNRKIKAVRAGAAVGLDAVRFEGNEAAFGGGASLLNLTRATVATAVFDGNRATKVEQLDHICAVFVHASVPVPVPVPVSLLIHLYTSLYTSIAKVMCLCMCLLELYSSPLCFKNSNL